MASNLSRFRAIRPCYHRSFYYNVGDQYFPTAEELAQDSVPEHFVKERDFTEEVVEAAEVEDRNRQVFVKPMKSDEVQSPAAPATESVVDSSKK